MFDLNILPPKYRTLAEENQTVEKTVNRLYRHSQSFDSTLTYLLHLNKFREWVKMPLDNLVSKYDLAEILNEYIDYLSENGYSPATIQIGITVLKKWCKVNKVEVDWSEVETPMNIPTQKSSLPTKDMLRQIVNFSDLRLKALIMTAVTSGLRIGTLVRLKIKNIPEYDIEDRRFTDDVPMIFVGREITKGKFGSYISFITPEAKDYLEAYLKDRDLTVDSYIFGKKRRKPQNSRTMEIYFKDMYNKILRKLSYDEKITFHKYRFHMLRKFFRTTLMFSGVQSDVIEYMMGHRSSIAQVYVIGDNPLDNPKIIELLRNEYMKAIPQLRINIDEKQIIHLERELNTYKNEYNKKVEEIESLELRLKKVERLLSNVIDKV